MVSLIAAFIIILFVAFACFGLWQGAERELEAERRQRINAEKLHRASEKRCEFWFTMWDDGVKREVRYRQALPVEKDEWAATFKD